MGDTDTIVAAATARGRSAIAMVRVSGPLVLELIQAALGKEGPTPRVSTLAKYRNSKNSQVIDEVLFTYFKKGSSYTGEDLVEIACHGNMMIMDAIVKDLVARGCRMAEPGEFTRRGYMNGSMDLSQAEAVCEVISASSERALQVAQRQLAGDLGKKISQYCEDLVNVVAHVEAYIDFPEDDLPVEDPKGPLEQVRRLIGEFKDLIETSRRRHYLDEGVKVVIAGAPNAGKSSLLNALHGTQRAIVSEEAGTTRDFITERIGIGPYSIQIMDTAGIHNVDTGIEGIGIQRAVEQIGQADLVLLVIDQTSPLPCFGDEVLNGLKKESTLVLYNKEDLGVDNMGKDTQFAEYGTVALSTKDPKSIENLRNRVEKWIRDHCDEGDELDILVNSRHAIGLQEAVDALIGALDKLEEGMGTEFVSLDLRGALDALGGIVGKVDNEIVLDKLFKEFCIGK